jgi:hypothetical protein
LGIEIERYWVIGRPGNARVFFRRKLEAEQKAKADAAAALRRATDAQVLEDAERLIVAWNERQTKTHADAVLADNRRRHHRRLLVPLGALSGVSNDQRRGSAHARSSPRCCRKQSHSTAVVPVVPAECAIRRARAAIANKHRR